MSRGLLLSLLSSLLFALLYYYTSLLAPLDGEAVYGWRMLLTFPCLSLFMLYSGDWQAARELIQRLLARPALLAGLLASSALLGIQLWLFMWAPLAGRALQVSLGYFLMPLVIVLVGRLFYRDRLTGLQRLAVACATLGVTHELYRAGGFSWETLVVAIGYPLYFVLRRQLGNNHLGGLWMDMLLMLPAAGWFVAASAPGVTLQAQPTLYPLILVLGALSAAALVCYTLASRMLVFSLFGLLGYVEPVLLVGVALLLGESIAPHEWLTYIPTWLAMGLLVLEGIRHLSARRRLVP
ncbi:EamA family transporter RarD [Zobellella maritima]|uniref:EamA family transporter RarD n=1 Tax=Zobellella maritima TaxID=2059725 RepID=UPI000E309F04|nr:EamA family transporter RarD [Zobellella maritima]